MRVFCPIHKKGFSAPRRNPIRCENKHHVLGELDFEGRAREPVEVSWEYCCNCEHFWPSDFADARCPVCDREISARYLCDKCYIFSLESSNPVAVKNFTLGPEGAPQPSCPCCLQESTNGTLPIPHQCDSLGITYTTTFRSCPFCDELIGGPPSFPAPTAKHLNSMWAIKRVSVDYERDMLVEAEDGEFVLILDGNASHKLIVIPALTNFITKQDFYERYQDYYHCENPSPGEVIVIEPTVVARVDGGWRLSEAGRLEVQVAAQETQQESVPWESPSVESGPATIETTITQQKPPIVCLYCGATEDSKKASSWTFCWKCGKPFGSKVGSSRGVPPTSTLDPSQKEQTISPGPTRFFSSFPISILKPTGPEPDSPSESGTATKLLVVGLVCFVVTGVLIWLALRSSPLAGPVGVANVQEAQQTGGSTNVNPTSAQTPAIKPEDYELLTIRERIANARPSERPQIVEDLRSAEQKYPVNYRFPYERAKLSTKGVASHDEALAALVAATERAMDAGQGNVMLSELMAGKDTYFRNISKKRDEWNALVTALKDGDRTRLEALAARLEQKRSH
jgi:hypothetical protein